MQKIREKLVATLGVAGYILFYGVYALITFAPLACVLDLHPLLNFLIIAVIMLFGYVGAVVELGLWVWSFIVAMSMPYDVFTLIYYIAFALYALRFLSLVISVVGYVICFLKEKREKSNADHFDFSSRKALFAILLVLVFGAGVVFSYLVIPEHLSTVERETIQSSSYDDGYSAGHQDGFSRGLSVGEDNGYEEGYSVGFDKGFLIGYNSESEDGSMTYDDIIAKYTRN